MDLKQRMPRRVVVMIGGNGSNLQALIDNPQHGKAYDIVGVLSHRPDAFGLQRATKAGLPIQVVDHTLFESRNDFEAALLEALKTWEPDWIALAGFMRVLSPDFVNAYRNQILNIHPALLPKYKGLHTHRRVLEAGDSQHGATVHGVTAALDDGPIIAQTAVSVLPDDDEATLAARVLAVEHQLYPHVITLAATGKLTLTEDSVRIADLSE